MTLKYSKTKFKKQGLKKSFNLSQKYENFKFSATFFIRFAVNDTYVTASWTRYQIVQPYQVTLRKSWSENKSILRTINGENLRVEMLFSHQLLPQVLPLDKLWLPTFSHSLNRLVYFKVPRNSLLETFQGLLVTS